MRGGFWDKKGEQSYNKLYNSEGGISTDSTTRAG